MEKEQFYYDNKIVKMFLIATIVWGVVGMLVGLLVAFLFIFPNYMEGISWLSFGRLRPLHTNAVIFAFVGNSIFMGIYYSMQRLLKARMFSDVLSKIHFWGWQLIIVAAAIKTSELCQSASNKNLQTAALSSSLVVAWSSPCSPATNKGKSEEMIRRGATTQQLIFLII